MPGPPPKPAAQRRRRNAAPLETTLPAGGRKGAAPKWPLGRRVAGEKELWRELWSTPQAVMWERSGWTRVVARYCRLTVESEKPGASVALLAEVRQLEDRLGLSPMAMRRLLWRVDGRDEVADKRESKAPARRRLVAVDPDAVAGT